AIDLIIENEFAAQFQRLTEANIPSTHPQWKELESQAISRREALLSEQENVIINEVLLDCQGSFGGASGACGQKIDIMEEILGSCEYGSAAGSACREAAQVVAYQLGCESSSDKGSCLGEAKKIATELKNPIKDETTQKAWIYSVEIAPEKHVAEENYLDLRSCGSGADCESKYNERLNENLLNLHEEWRVTHDSLTLEQRTLILQEKETRRG
ncbi:hypothetical protein HZC08_00095, partial [Candidatus Micrarchaeota archaeon]|nr:hypothetical protein [Candidatus Micrarchaeota archaeon]